ncbi:hypothetical protein C9I28_21590 [Pseudoduganella armeniaca]|uniref:DUF4157 domain-containing protein n=1 Tax=Pseudoduganella armeniaca TaxID=2072590 RepID=A0A2R4CE72_9BURK|nr:hypothetical protein C9I28_21590 [Pseudoduganella armeniaca]
MKACAASAALLALLCVFVVAFPQPAFAYRIAYQNYEVWSDRPIPRAIEPVLDDVTRRWRTSPLYDRATPAQIFICNEPWRMWLYGMHFSTQFGGVADVWLTRHVVIRAADIEANRIVPPGPAPIADAAQRPLSYFIAHELTHSDVSRRFGRTMMLRYPEWLLEGYADYVGKAGDFDYAANRAAFIAGAPAMDRRKSGLYRGYHLKVAYLLDQQGWPLERLFAQAPAEQEVERWLRAGK